MMLFYSILMACSGDKQTAENRYQKVQQVVDAQCMNCHGKGVAAGQLDLTIGLCSSTREVAASNYEGVLVVPYQIEQSIFWHKVSGSGIYGANMPDDNALNSADVQIIEEWITNGALCPDEVHNPAVTDPISECANPDAASIENVDSQNGLLIHDDICMYCHANASSPQLEVIIPVNSDDRIQEIICKDSGFVDELTGGISQQDFYDVLSVLREMYPEAPLAIAGEYLDGDVEHVITSEQWVYVNQLGTWVFDITQIRNEERYVVAQNSSSNSANAGKWSRFDWVIEQDELYYCQISVQDESAQTAEDNDNANPDNLTSGCNQQPWRNLVQQ